MLRTLLLLLLARLQPRIDAWSHAETMREAPWLADERFWDDERIWEWDWGAPEAARAPTADH